MEKRIYTCATAHVDTVWNWDFEHTISVCLYNTLVENFKLFKKYPDYKFNFEGSYRYELMEEYYPDYFKQMKEYIEQGKWNVTGSAFENGDVNVPSPEALFRNILYGNEYFKKTFDKQSKEIYLPDCFGFGWALPSIIDHANLWGFTTQKLTWGSAFGKPPFDIGKWYGVNGKHCFACTNPDEYVMTFNKIRNKPFLANKLKENEEKYNLPWTFAFHGDGDQGGAPKDKSVAVLANEMAENDSNDVKVLSVASDQIYYDLRDLTDEQKEKLPRWDTELVMTNHGVGGYTSRAIGKRWNRRNEELADMTERSSVVSHWLGVTHYPKEIIDKSWKRVIAHQFHDDLPGTSVQRAYQRTWNDYVLSLNQFENTLSHSVSAIAQQMDTSWVSGTAIVVYNSIETHRRELVKLQLNIGNAVSVKVFDKDGNEMPAQISKRSNKGSVVHFIADVERLGYKVYDLVYSSEKASTECSLKLTMNSIENQYFAVKLNENGDIASIFDKRINKELLREPIVFDILSYNGSKNWPAWELDYKDVSSHDIHHAVKRDVKVHRKGVASIALKVTQTYGNSRFKTIISLSDNDDAVHCECEIRWKNLRTLLKNRFSLNVSNEMATFDLGLGAIKRGNSTENLYEVPAQKWADISNDDFGVTIISDSKYGWDKPNNNTLRMTAIHTPKKNYQRDSMQSMMELGLNRYGYAIYSHKGDVGSGSQAKAREINQPMATFVSDKHSGPLGDSFSLGSISNNSVILRCVKMAENSDEIVVRFNECTNDQQNNVEFSLCDGIESAREIYASEEAIGEATVKDGKLLFDIEPYGVKSFAIKLNKCNLGISTPIAQKQIKLEGNISVFNEQRENFIQVRKSDILRFPKELRPEKIQYCGIEFTLNERTGVACKGQKITMPDEWKKMFLLISSFDGDKKDVEFICGNKVQKADIFSIDDRIGKWDLYSANETANIKECKLAYEFTHSHTIDGDDYIAHQMYVYCVELNIDGAKAIQLPKDPAILILSATVANGYPNCQLAYPLYDREKARDVHLDFTATDKMNYLKLKLPHNMNAIGGIRKRAKPE